MRPPGFQCGRVELLRGGVGGGEPAAAAAVALNGVAAAGVADLVADPIGEQFDGLHEADVLDLLEECVDVAAFPQPKQWKWPWLGRTWNDGDFSSWNRHRPFIESAPARRSWT